MRRKNSDLCSGHGTFPLVVVELMMMVDFIGNQLPGGHIDLISMFLSCPPLDQQAA